MSPRGSSFAFKLVNTTSMKKSEYLKLNPQVEVIEPAVKGTANVLEACLKANVERVVFVSSAAAVFINPNLPKDKAIDESCWSDKDYCKNTKVTKILLYLCMT